MVVDIPEDVRNLVRAAFSKANDEVTRAISRQPAIHEEVLDQLLVLAMNKVPLAISPISGAALAIDTHWLGGRRFYLQRWEIADIALVAVLRLTGQVVWRKVALLQSKRLYSREIEIAQAEDNDYFLRIGRVIDQNSLPVPLFHQQPFSFSGESTYKELRPGDQQVRNIDNYSRERSMPVYYSFYNPLDIPFQVIAPQVYEEGLPTVNKVGCRVVRSTEVHEIVSSMGSSPSFDEINGLDRSRHRGWRIEHFVADSFLCCHEGRKFHQADHPDLQSLLYERSAPISAAVVFTIDLPSDYREG